MSGLLEQSGTCAAAALKMDDLVPIWYKCYTMSEESSARSL